MFGLLLKILALLSICCVLCLPPLLPMLHLFFRRCFMRLPSALHFWLLGCVMAAGCGSTPTPPSSPDPLPTKPLVARIAKWYNNHRAAISLTYDHGWDAPPSDEQEHVLTLCKQQGIEMDLDAVTFMWNQTRRDFVRDVLLPQGHRFFGHGHWHIDHDTLSYDSARASFAECYQIMASLGLHPVAYAYPGGYGNQQETRQALADAGFLCGRLFASSSRANPWIMPDTASQPDDWYALPSLIMLANDTAEFTNAIHTTAELIPYLDETVRRSAWLIPTYHEVKDGHGGTYRVKEFEGDIAAITERDFWTGSISAVTLYARQRAAATAMLQPVVYGLNDTAALLIMLSDNLPNGLYNQPLTLLIEIPEAWVGKQVTVQQRNVEYSRQRPTGREIMVNLLPNEQEYRVEVIE